METLSNPQRDRFQKATQYDPLYLLDVSVKDENKLEWKISGSTRNVYTVSCADGKMKCNCPDQLMYSSKLRTVCKHIVFTLWKVCKYRDYNYYEHKQITPEVFLLLKNHAMQREGLLNDHEISDPTLVKNFENIKMKPSSSASASARAIEARHIDDEDECPICYMALKNGSPLQVCATCRNSVHQTCFSKWLEFNKTCVYCRTTFYIPREVTSSKYQKV